MKIFLLGTCLISFLMHFIALDYPREVVFDEVHYGKFVDAYYTKTRIFDVHPPHAKLVMAGVAKFFGHQAGFNYSKIGEQLPEHVQIVGLRFASALAGSLLPVVVFFLLMALNSGMPAAVFGAVAVLFENALLVETRLLLLDGILLVSILLALLFLSMAGTAEDGPYNSCGVSGVVVGQPWP